MLLYLNVESYEPLHDKNNKMTCACSENWDQTGWMPRLMGVFARRTGHFIVICHAVARKQYFHESHENAGEQGHMQPW